MSAHWSTRREGGGHFAVWLIRGIGLRCGRGFARLCLYPITLYFFLRRPYERRVSRAFLTRAFGRPASSWQVLRHIHCFAATLLDRIFLLSERYRRFDVRMHGCDELLAALRPDRGVLLLGAHVGSFEVLRVAAVERPDLDLHVVLDVTKTPAQTALLHALAPDVARRVIDASRPGTEIVLALAEALERGALAALLADRARPGERTLMMPFMGAPAPFPVAPFLLGPVLGAPVLLCFGMYRGGNRYDVYFEPFAAPEPLPRRGREAALQALVQRYAERLEHHVRQDPYNWFNWHDFWNGEEAGAGVPGPGTAADGAAVVGRSA
ncbi:acyltransferase [Dokdonella sp.]|uniref:LpxL/LpxP family acyltransferase n=1 Tax=Dokdonella sp. TaxID=2291710 RepID=UPI0031BFEDBA|nr:acyltransferase [Dokdonella sp.]